MEIALYIFLCLPLLGMLITFLIPQEQERKIASRVVFISGVSAFFWTIGTIYWITQGAPTLSTSHMVLYDSEHYTYQLTFLFDRISAAYLGFSTILTFLITKYSQYYLHKEEGFKRFFLTILLFVLSIYLIILSGNFETLFLGWEILGISSFMLIAYYWNRYLPVRNAFKVYTVYRVADAGLLLAMWLSHHVFHQNVDFVTFQNSDMIQKVLENNPNEMIAIALLIGLSAAVKSAQFPFSTWLPRAMEGPTPSSAIFYGSIAINIGCFLMLRTYPLWENVLAAKIFFITLSIVTLIMTSIVSKVQSSVKAQIAYASISQISIIFIEIALGWHTVALIHFTGNAFLRAYQLLISPSIVTYVMREQFFNYKPMNSKLAKSRIQNRWRNTIMVAGLKEWRIDSFLYKLVWSPMKKIGKHSVKVSTTGITILSAFAIIGAFSAAQMDYAPMIHNILATISGIGALLITLGAFTEKSNPKKAFTFLIFAHFWIVISISFNDTFSLLEAIYYLSGIVLSGFVGYWALTKVLKKYPADLNDFYGLVKKEKNTAFIFLLAAITMAGFPLSTTFIGEDLLFTHIEKDQLVIVFLTIMVYIVEGIALIRLYTRLFLGPYKSNEEYFARRYA